MSATIKVIDNLSEEVLFECSMEDSEKAYTFAKQMEELHLDVRLEAPGAAESLAMTLGANEEVLGDLRATLIQELEDHED